MRRHRMGAMLTCAWAMFWAVPAAADVDVWDVGGQAAWISVSNKRSSPPRRTWAWPMRGPGTPKQACASTKLRCLRPEVATGVTWVYDVTTYVPAATLAVGMVYPDARPSVLGPGAGGIATLCDTAHLCGGAGGGGGHARRMGRERGPGLFLAAREMSTR